MNAQGEISLLTGILSDSDPNGKECPAPAILCALVEEERPETAAVVAALRAHVAQCSRCAELGGRLKGFAELPQTGGASESAKAAEAAWAAAAPRLSRRIQQVLDNQAQTAKQRQEPISVMERVFWWKRLRLPSFELNRLNVAWALAGFALVAVATISSVAYYSRQEPDAGVLQSATMPAPEEQSAAGAPTEREAETVKPPAEEPGEGEHDAAAALPAPPAAKPETGRGPAASFPGSSSGISAQGTGVSPKEALPAGPTMLLSSGSLARITISSVASEPNGSFLVQGKLLLLEPIEGKREAVAFFSALVAAGHSGPVTIGIRSFTVNGMEFQIQSGDSTRISISWPTNDDRLAVGATFEVELISGAMLRGKASPK